MSITPQAILAFKDILATKLKKITLALEFSAVQIRLGYDTYALKTKFYDDLVAYRSGAAAAEEISTVDTLLDLCAKDIRACIHFPQMKSIGYCLQHYYYIEPTYINTGCNMCHGPCSTSHNFCSDYCFQTFNAHLKPSEQIEDPCTESYKCIYCQDTIRWTNIDYIPHDGHIYCSEECYKSYLDDYFTPANECW
jgi:hypothetical protein